jgi:hypothetical protein
MICNIIDKTTYIIQFKQQTYESNLNGPNFRGFRRDRTQYFGPQFPEHLFPSGMHSE